MALVNNGIIVEYGKFDYGTLVQLASKIINLPISYNKTYSVIINATNGNGGIPSPTANSISNFTFLLRGPWDNWPSRYGNWITIGY